MIVVVESFFSAVQNVPVWARKTIIGCKVLKYKGLR